jgi:hypothetical protein
MRTILTNTAQGLHYFALTLALLAACTANLILVCAWL